MIAALKNDIHDRDATLATLLHEAKFRSGEPGSHCTKYGRYHIAIVRNKAHVGADTVLAMVAS